MVYTHTSANKFEGMVCAPFTPYNGDGELNLAIIPDYAAFLRENGISGVFVNGSSGEGLLLTEDERRLTAEAWAKECGADLRLIVHVAAGSVRNCASLAAHAQDLGAFAISAIGPTFPPLAKVAQLGAYCAEIAKAAPDLPFYYYHIPALSRVDLPMLDLLDFARQHIPNFAGIKYTSTDLHDLTRCTRYDNRRYDILAGLDETMLGAMAVANSCGFIGGTFNYCAPIYSRLIEAFRAGDLELARSLQEKSQDIIEVLIKYNGNMVAGKQMMRLVGLDLGGARTPLAPMPPRDFERMADDLHEAGFFDHCNTLGGVRQHRTALAV